MRLLSQINFVHASICEGAQRQWVRAPPEIIPSESAPPRLASVGLTFLPPDNGAISSRSPDGLDAESLDRP